MEGTQFRKPPVWARATALLSGGEWLVQSSAFLGKNTYVHLEALTARG